MEELQELQELHEKIEQKIVRDIDNDLPAKDVESLKKLGNEIATTLLNTSLSLVNTSLSNEDKENCYNLYLETINGWLRLLKKRFNDNATGNLFEISTNFLNLDGINDVYDLYENLVEKITKTYNDSKIKTMFPTTMAKKIFSFGSAKTVGFEVMKKFLKSLIDSVKILKISKTKKQKLEEDLETAKKYGAAPDVSYSCRLFFDLLRRNGWRRDRDRDRDELTMVAKALKIRSLHRTIKRKAGNLMCVVRYLTRWNEPPKKNIIVTYLKSLKEFGKNARLDSLLSTQKLSYDTLGSWLAMHQDKDLSSKEMLDLCSTHLELKKFTNVLSNDTSGSLTVKQWIAKLKINSGYILKIYKELGGDIPSKSYNSEKDGKPTTKFNASPPKQKKELPAPSTKKLPLYSNEKDKNDSLYLIKQVRDVYLQADSGTFTEAKLLRAFLTSSEAKKYKMFYDGSSPEDIRGQEYSKIPQSTNNPPLTVRNFMDKIRDNLKKKSGILREKKTQKSEQYVKERDYLKSINLISQRLSSVRSYYFKIEQYHSKEKENDGSEEKTSYDVTKDEDLREIFKTTIEKQEYSKDKLKMPNPPVVNDQNPKNDPFEKALSAINVKELDKLAEEVYNLLKKTSK